MLWHPQKEVWVTSRAELDEALRRADRIVVEGDAGLAAYAAFVAGAEDAAPAARLRPLGDIERSAHMAVGGGTPRLWPWVAGAAMMAAGAAAAVLLEHFTRVTATLAPPPQAAAPPAPLDLTRLAWPSVAVVLIVALFFIVRQAISDGRDVQVTWKVTEKVQGRVVITKIRTRVA